MSGSNSRYTYKKTIYDIGTEILRFQCLNCFKTRLFCKSIIPEDSKISRRDLSFGSAKSRFKAILKKKSDFSTYIGTEILKFQCLNCFKTPLFCKSIIPEDSKISRRDLSFASVKSRFKAIFKNVKFSTQCEIYRICRLSTK